MPLINRSKGAERPLFSYDEKDLILFPNIMREYIFRNENRSRNLISPTGFVSSMACVLNFAFDILRVSTKGVSIF